MEDCFMTMFQHTLNGSGPKYLRDLIRLFSPTISLRPLRSLDRHDLFIPRARTSVAQTRAFAIIGPADLNQLPPSTRFSLLTGKPSASFVLSRLLSFFSECLALESLLIGMHFKKRYITVRIQCNTI